VGISGLHKRHALGRGSREVFCEFVEKGKKGMVKIDEEGI